MKLSELTYDQKCHLAWRLDRNTECGYLTAQRISRGELGDMELTEIFLNCGRNERSAKILSHKVSVFDVFKTKKIKN
jgi:hypothetical protein